MSKTAKKLLSVVLAVLVLAAGFATTFAAFKPVSADEMDIYDYTSLEAEHDAKPVEDIDSAVVVSQYDKGWKQFGFDSVNAIRIESSDPTTTGFKVSDTFFTSRDRFSPSNLGGHSKDDYKAFIVYAVEPSSSFTANYIKYNDTQFNNININKVGKTYGDLELLVSSDGVNFIPANAKTIKTGEPTSLYDAYTATIADVGNATRYVKVVFPQHMDDSTYRLEGEEWVDSYVPQDAFVLQKVICKAGTGLGENEVKLDTNNVNTSWSSAFLAANSGINEAVAIDGNTSSGGYTPLTWNEVYNKQWGAIPAVNRTLLMRAQPGTRFSVKVRVSEHYLTRVREALKTWSAEQLANVQDTDCEVKVYTSSGDNVWTEYRYTPSNISAGGSEFSSDYYYSGSWKIGGNIGSTAHTIDLILPENHSYVKIVFPWEGDPNHVAFYNEDGTVQTVTHETAGTVNLVAGDGSGRGNDTIRMQQVIYTPYNAETVPTISYNTSHTYAAISANLTSSTPISNANKWWTSYGAVAGQNHKNLLITTNKADLGIAVSNNYSITAGKENELNDDELPYLIYEVAGGTYFEVDTFIRKHSGTAAWNLGSHDANSLKGDFEFGIYASDSIDGEWVQCGSLTFNCLTTIYDTDNYYTCSARVPENAKYVKVVYGIRGRALYTPETVKVGDDGYVTGTEISGNGSSVWNGARWDDAVGLRGVRFTTNSADHKTDAYSDWHCGTNYFAEDGTTNKPAVYPSDANYCADSQTVFANGVQVDNHTRSRYGLQIIYGNRTTKADVTYKVLGGTTFSALAGIGVEYHKTRVTATDSTKLEDFEFEFYTAAQDDDNGEWTLQYTTNTETIEQLRFDIHDVSINVPEDHNYVKIVFPNLGSAANGNVGNQEAMVYSVSYVPGSYQDENIKEFDYRETTLATAGSQVKDNKGVLGVYSATSGILFNEAATSQALNVGVNSIKSDWGTVGPFEVIYEVQPGSKFSTDLYLATGSIGGWNKQTLSHLLGGTPWEFTVEASNAVDGQWKHKVDTSSYTSAEITLDYNVPADCKFVKITFPQRGQVETLCTDTTCSGYNTNHMRTDPVQGNDLARIRSVSYIPFGVVDTNDYTKGEATFADTNKAEYNLYKLNNVEATTNGIVAKAGATEAFVEYKVSNEAALVIETANNLKIAVSYDDVKFVDAQIKKYAGAYTLNLVEGKQYVRVYLGEGDAITAVTAKHLTPTATFINAAGKEESIDVFYGAIPAEPTLNKYRAGYTFSKWGKDGLNEGIYVDTVYVAKYNKNEAEGSLFTVGLRIGSMGKITVNNDRTLDTVRFDDRVTVEAPAVDNGAKFDKWVAYDKDGNCLGTISNSHKFSFLASDSIILDAEYFNEGDSKTEDKPFIFNGNAIVKDNDNGTWNMSVIWRVNAPADVTVEETGILFAATDLGANANTKEECDDAWKAGIEAGIAKVRAHKTTAANKTLMYTVNNISAAKDARFAVPYAIIDGEYVFGNVVSAQ